MRTITDMQAGIMKRLEARSWWAFAQRFMINMGNDNVGLIAAGIAFYFLMAAFPAIGAAISLFGLFSDPHMITSQIDKLDRFLPGDALNILSSQAQKIASTGDSTLTISLLISLLLTIYSTTQGAKAIIQGCNIAYNEKESRNFLKLNLTAYGMTVLLLLSFLSTLTLVGIIPAVVAFVRLPPPMSDLVLLMRWPFMFIAAIVGFGLVYRIAPDRKKKEWHWITPGAILGTLMWVSGSALFSFYVTNFGSYNETYGSLGAVIILLLWFWLTAMTILVGAEINATAEAVVEPEGAVKAADAGKTQHGSVIPSEDRLREAAQTTQAASNS